MIVFQILTFCLNWQDERGCKNIEQHKPWVAFYTSEIIIKGMINLTKLMDFSICDFWFKMVLYMLYQSLVQRHHKMFLFFFFFQRQINRGSKLLSKTNRGWLSHLWVQPLPQAYNAAEVEAMAAGRAIEFGLVVSLQWMLLERDSGAVVTALDWGFWISSLWVVTQGCQPPFKILF